MENWWRIPFRRAKRSAEPYPDEREEEPAEVQTERVAESSEGTYWADRRLLDVVPFRDVILFTLAAILAVAIPTVGYLLRSIFGPILIALMLAYLFNPLITLAKERARMPRALTISLLLIALFLVGLGFVLWLVPLLVGQIGGIVKDIQLFVSHPPQWVLKLARLADFNLANLPEAYSKLAQRLTQNPTDILHFLFAGSSEAVGFIGKVVGTTTYFAITIALIPIYFFFFAWHFQYLYRLERYLPRKKKAEIKRILQKMDGVVSNFFRGRLIVAAVMSAMYMLGWWLAEVPYALVLGVLAGLLSIIPYVAIIVWPVSVLLAYIEAAGAVEPVSYYWLDVLIWPSVVYVSVQLVEGWILTPWIQKSATDLSAVTIIIVIFIGGALGGLYGMILAIPVAACVKILFREVFLPRLRRWADSR